MCIPFHTTYHAMLFTIDTVYLITNNLPGAHKNYVIIIEVMYCMSCSGLHHYSLLLCCVSALTNTQARVTV